MTKAMIATAAALLLSACSQKQADQANVGDGSIPAYNTTENTPSAPVPVSGSGQVPPNAPGVGNQDNAANAREGQDEPAGR